MRFVNTNSVRPAALFSVATFAAISLSLSAGCGGSSSNTTLPAGTRIVTGETETVSGATVATWARLDAANSVLEAGVTVPLSVIANPPAPEPVRSTRHAGHSSEVTVGPAGAFVVIDFPDEVKATTFLNHYEMHWNPDGHEPERYEVPHFDLHFYNQTPEQVKAVTAPDTIAPNANQIPTGYVYPGVMATVPEMGVHAAFGGEFAPGAEPFSASMILGYYKGKMTFVEPMITQTALLAKQTITLDVPRPEVLGQSTRYPTKFTAVYDSGLDAYQCTFSDFVTMNQ
jgi:hypothetical protein